MKTLIFSDTHLGPKFEEKKFNFLKKRIEEAQRVIINGDFWEGYFFNFEQFLASPWRALFPYLKKRQTVYLYGNHDKKIQVSKKVHLFSAKQAAQYRQKLNGHTLVVEHGNRLWNTGDDEVIQNKRTQIATRLVHRIERVITRNDNFRMKQLIFGRYNKIIKNKIKKEFTSNELLVCGHTHFAEFNLKERFINSGIIRHGLAQYLVVEETTIKPKEEWYD